MKKILLILNILLIFILTGCSADSAPNTAEAYKIVIDKLYNEDEGLNSEIKYLAVDTKSMKNLTDKTKAELLKSLEHYGLAVLDMSFEELEKQGYIKDLYFKEGVLFEIEDEIMKNNSITMNVSKWRSGLGAIGYDNLVIKYKNGEWKIIKTGNAWIS